MKEGLRKEVESYFHLLTHFSHLLIIQTLKMQPEKHINVSHAYKIIFFTQWAEAIIRIILNIKCMDKLLMINYYSMWILEKVSSAEYLPPLFPCFLHVQAGKVELLHFVHTFPSWVRKSLVPISFLQQLTFLIWL